MSQWGLKNTEIWEKYRRWRVESPKGDQAGLESSTRFGNVLASSSEDTLLGTVYVENIKLELKLNIKRAVFNS